MSPGGLRPAVTDLASAAAPPATRVRSPGQVSALLSLAAVLMYVIETYATQEIRYGRLFGATEIVMAFFFLGEWIVHFWISDHRVRGAPG